MTVGSPLLLVIVFATGFFSGIATLVVVVWFFLHDELGPPPSRPDGWS